MGYCVLLKKGTNGQVVHPPTYFRSTNFPTGQDDVSVHTSGLPTEAAECCYAAYVQVTQSGLCSDIVPSLRTGHCGTLSLQIIASLVLTY